MSGGKKNDMNYVRRALNAVKKPLLTGAAALALAQNAEAQHLRYPPVQYCVPGRGFPVVSPVFVQPFPIYAQPFYPGLAYSIASRRGFISYQSYQVPSAVQIYDPRVVQLQEENTRLREEQGQRRAARSGGRAEAREPAPAARDGDTYEFGYSGRICPEQYVPEANSLMNYVFDKVAESGGRRFHAYAFRNSELYTVVKDGNNNIVLTDDFPDLRGRNVDGPQFVARIERSLRDIGIDMNRHTSVVYREYAGRCRQ